MVRRWVALQTALYLQAEASVSGSYSAVLTGILPVLLLPVLIQGKMHRTPAGPQRSPGFSPRPSPDWTFPGVRSPFGGSPRFSPGFSPGSPRGSPRFSRGNMDGSPAHYGGGGRGFGGPVRRGGGFRRPQSFSPCGAPNLQVVLLF